MNIFLNYKKINIKFRYSKIFFSVECVPLVSVNNEWKTTLFFQIFFLRARGKQWVMQAAIFNGLGKRVPEYQPLVGASELCKSQTDWLTSARNCYGNGNCGVAQAKSNMSIIINMRPPGKPTKKRGGADIVNNKLAVWQFCFYFASLINRHRMPVTCRQNRAGKGKG